MLPVFCGVQWTKIYLACNMNKDQCLNSVIQGLSYKLWPLRQFGILEQDNAASNRLAQSPYPDFSFLDRHGNTYSRQYEPVPYR